MTGSLNVLNLTQQINQARDIVPIDRPKYFMPIVSKICPGRMATLTPSETCRQPARPYAQHVRQTPDKPLGQLLGLAISRAHTDTFQILAEMHACGSLMLMPLSLRTMSICRLSVPALLSPSKASPFTIEASPTTATTLPFLPRTSARRAIPTAVLMAVPACPTANRSWADSNGFGKPLTDPFFRRVGNIPARPVSILCG